MTTSSNSRPHVQCDKNPNTKVLQHHGGPCRWVWHPMWKCHFGVAGRWLVVHRSQQTKGSEHAVHEGTMGWIHGVSWADVRQRELQKRRPQKHFPWGNVWRFGAQLLVAEMQYWDGGTLQCRFSPSSDDDRNNYQKGLNHCTIFDEPKGHDLRNGLWEFSSPKRRFYGTELKYWGWFLVRFSSLPWCAGWPGR